ncbi:MAG: hypothetical protein JNK82_24685 [Myxococcaceae bacterium]|nr:hypothetical protein [Myxococcaceae bacterium]
MPGVGIFARHTDPIAKHLAARLMARGAEVEVLELARLTSGAPLAFDVEEWLYEGVALSELDAFFVRQVPAETAMLAEAHVSATAGEWWQKAVKAKERWHLAQSALQHLELMGKRVLNPAASVPFDYKPLQLAVLQRAGIRVPRTLITNFAPGVRQFAADVGEVIYKPVGGGTETAVLDEAALARLDELAGAPVIFQERISGPDIRVTVVNGRIVSSVEIPTSTSIDYRLDPDYRAGAQAYVAHALPDAQQRWCLEAARLCHQIVSGIDLKWGADGYVMLEANSGPVYLDIELKTGAPITDAIADVLLAG